MQEVESKPDVLGGVPCFSGTRVPVEILFELVRRGYTVDYFLAQYPTVARGQVEAVLDLAKRQMHGEALRAAG